MQSEAGAFPTRASAANLAERLKKPVFVFRPYANAGIAHNKFSFGSSVDLALLEFKPHAAFFGELDGIIGQVQQDLL